MHILIMGAGALGSYFGARLQAAGHEVTFVARGAHLAAMQARGLRVESKAGDVSLPQVRAVATPNEAPAADAVYFLVKNYDVEEAARVLKPTLGAETFVVTGQNGISAPDRLAEVIGVDRVVPGVVRMPADLKAPGVVRHPVVSHDIVIGERGGAASERINAFAEAVRGAGMGCVVARDIDAALWHKFIVLSTFSALTALTRLDIGPIRDDEGSRPLILSCVEEAFAVGKAVKPDLPDQFREEAREILLTRLEPDIHASMLDDLLRGKRIELDYLSGDICRMGRLHGIPTPTHDFVVAALSPLRDGAPPSV